MSRNKEALIRAAGESDHWKGLAEFARWEMWAGGPDPHMNLTAKMADMDGADWPEKAWRGLCYLGAYVVPTAARIWSEWPWERMQTKDVKKLPAWLATNWEGIVLRRERKCVRSAIKLGKFLISAADWLREKIWDKSMSSGWICYPLDKKSKYEVAWEDALRIYGMGRYIAMKYLEYGNRHLDFGTEVPDIRPEGGWSPRLSMVLLYPEHANALLGGDSLGELRVVNRCATEGRKRLLAKYKLDLSYYQFQVCLCDYKQSRLGRRQFPGRSQDSELAYERKIAPYWGDRLDKMYEARKVLFPGEVLGELNDWDYVRKDLGDCLALHGYTWTDQKFLYNESKSNLAKPVARK